MTPKDLIRSLRVRLLHLRAALCPQIPTATLGRVLIVAPHPDDEVIGCAGLIARLTADGNPPQVVILTRGEASHRDCCHTPANDIAAARHNLTLRAARILRLPQDNIHTLTFPDGSIPPQSSDPQLTTLVRSADTILVPHWGEGWPDHLNAANIIRHIISTPEPEATPTTQPEAAPQPQTTPQPEAAPQPQTTTQPEATPQSQTTTQPEATPQPPTSTQQTTLTTQTPTTTTPPKNHPTLIQYSVWLWYYNVWHLDWPSARTLTLTPAEHTLKLQATDAYVIPTAPCGKPWSGQLPAPFLQAAKWHKELYFIEK